MRRENACSRGSKEQCCGQRDERMYVTESHKQTTYCERHKRGVSLSEVGYQHGTVQPRKMVRFGISSSPSHRCTDKPMIT